jgi:hypothetical protein
MESAIPAVWSSKGIIRKRLKDPEYDSVYGIPALHRQLTRPCRAADEMMLPQEITHR